MSDDKKAHQNKVRPFFPSMNHAFGLNNQQYLIVSSLSIEHSIENSPTKITSTYNFPYPCSSQKECSLFILKMRRDVYQIELYGEQERNEINHNVESGKGAYKKLS